MVYLSGRMAPLLSELGGKHGTERGRTDNLKRKPPQRMTPTRD